MDKTFKMDKDYDVQNDVLYLRIKDDYKYKESIEIEDNIIVDLDVNYRPVALEIVEATSILDVSKFSLKKLIKWDMYIKIDEYSIRINASFIVPVRHKKVEKPITAKTMNDINLPNIQTHYDLATA
ncbi:MAG: DUF2283 domain-containing protein [Methanobacteriaceae archaeon]|jgi:uncharacterized protein YuzE|nr:DUF2283 domain-containing protein [Methanobacteriaceae archaeon]